MQLGSKHTEQSNRKRAASLSAYFDRVGRKTPAEHHATERAYWAAHQAEKKAKDARSYAKHRDERLTKIRAYAAAHRQEALDRVKLWRAANRARCNTINVNRRARLAKAEGSHTTEEWEQLKARCDYRCQDCGKPEPEIKLTRDHIVPLARGGSNYISNILPLCGRCNCEKHANIE